MINTDLRIPKTGNAICGANGAGDWGGWGGSKGDGEEAVEEGEVGRKQAGRERKGE